MSTTTKRDLRGKLADKKKRHSDTATPGLQSENKGKRTRRGRNASSSHTRSRTGCYTCRLRRKKCDETRPVCQACQHLKIKCEYNQPSWWMDDYHRAYQKRCMKDYIRRNRSDERAAIAAATHSEPHYVQRQGAYYPRLNPYARAPATTAVAATEVIAPGQYLPNYDAFPLGSAKRRQNQTPWDDIIQSDVSNAQISYNTQPILSVAKVASLDAGFSAPSGMVTDIPTFPANMSFTNSQATNDSYNYNSSMKQCIPPRGAAIINTQMHDSTLQGYMIDSNAVSPLLNARKGVSDGNPKGFVPGGSSPNSASSPPDLYQLPGANFHAPFSHQIFDMKHMDAMYDEFFGVGSIDQFSLQLANGILQGQNIDVPGKRMFNEQTEHLPLGTTFIPGDKNIPGQISTGNVDDGVTPNGPVQPIAKTQTTANVNGVNSPRENNSDTYFLQHFLDSTITRILPYFSLTNHDYLVEEIIKPALKYNECFRHCALLASAVHKQWTGINPSDVSEAQVDHYQNQAFNTLYEASQDDAKFLDQMHAVMALILLENTACGGESLIPRVQWHGHFKIIMENIQRQNLHEFMRSSGNESDKTLLRYTLALSSWVDIIGATMLSRKPYRAATYSARYQTGASTGLRTLMGCDDQIMYILSEAACLDVLSQQQNITDEVLQMYISNLIGEIEKEENDGEQVLMPCDDSGMIDTGQLSVNITALYRVAVRVYVLSLSPSFEYNRREAYYWLDKFAILLSYMSPGPTGYDASLVWPLLICGSYAPHGSHLRAMLDARFELSVFPGNFSRMAKVVREIWRVTDSRQAEISRTRVHARSTRGSKYPPLVRWRDVMKANGWDYLLM